MGQVHDTPEITLSLLMLLPAHLQRRVLGTQVTSLVVPVGGWVATLRQRALVYDGGRSPGRMVGGTGARLGVVDGVT